MPIYEYECKDCHTTFEKLMLSCDDDENMECPECRCGDVGKLMSAGAVRPQGIPKGSGGFTPPPSKCSAGGG